MNTFYYFENGIYETLEAVQFAKKQMGRYGYGNIDEIQTYKSFDEFEEEYDKAIAEGNSSLDAIDCAR